MGIAAEGDGRKESAGNKTDGDGRGAELRDAKDKVADTDGIDTETTGSDSNVTDEDGEALEANDSDGSGPKIDGDVEPPKDDTGSADLDALGITDTEEVIGDGVTATVGLNNVPTVTVGRGVLVGETVGFKSTPRVA